MTVADDRPDRDTVPPALRDAIAGDLRPVAPLASPWRRAALLVPLAFVVVAGVPWVLGLRSDAPAIGGWLS